MLIRLAIAGGLLGVFFIGAYLYRLHEDKKKSPELEEFQEIQAGDDLEVAAAIAAAISVALGTAPHNFKIVKVTPEDDGAAWRNYSRQRLFSKRQGWE